MKEDDRSIRELESGNDNANGGMLDFQNIKSASVLRRMGAIAVFVVQESTYTYIFFIADDESSGGGNIFFIVLCYTVLYCTVLNCAVPRMQRPRRTRCESNQQSQA